MTQNLKWGLLGLALLATACTDPAIGDWEAKSAGACGRDEFTVKDDLTGKGTVWAVDGAGSCLRCDFDFDELDEDSGSYDGKLDFDVCNCNGDTTADISCDINDDGDELDCGIEWGACVNGSQDFEKN